MKKCCSKSDNAAVHVNVISMYSIAMDVGKYRTYGIGERDGKITKEGYMPTTKEGFQSFMDGIDHATLIVEASSTASSNDENSNLLITSFSRMEFNDSMCASSFGVAGCILSCGMLRDERNSSTVLLIN